MEHREYGWAFWLHSAIIAFAWTSWMLVSWFVVLMLAIIYHVQLLVFKGCVLTHHQFKRKDQGFYEYYLGKLGFSIERSKLDFVLTWVVPAGVLSLAVLYQVFFGFSPLLG